MGTTIFMKSYRSIQNMKTHILLLHKDLPKVDGLATGMRLTFKKKIPRRYIVRLLTIEYD